jgi:hypothetical protein
VSVYGPPILHFVTPQLPNFEIDAGSVPDSAFELDADPDSAFHADPGSASQNDADPDPQHWIHGRIEKLDWKLWSCE